MQDKLKTIKNELAGLINSHSLENGSNTPDFILAAYLLNCLTVFDHANNWNTAWHSKDGVPADWRENGPPTAVRAHDAGTDEGLRKALAEGLSWALDLLDMYDKKLIEMGEPAELVYAPIHLAGKEKARKTLQASHAAESAPVSTAPECCPHKDEDHVLTAYRRYCKYCSCETKECSCKSWRGINTDCPMHREGRLKAQDEPTLAEKVHAVMTAGVKDVGVDHFYGKSPVAQDWRFMESETKLERCPFCGGTPHLQCDHKFFVLCLNCHCAVGERYDPDGWPAHEFSTAADAIAAWNTRASDPAALAVVEAQDAELEKEK